MNEEGQILGESKIAAKIGITQCVIGRILMAAPCLVLPAIIMKQFKNYNWYKNFIMNSLATTLISSSLLVVSVPFGCAIVPQTASINVNKLENNLKNDILSKYP